jgi:hypothetical protein
MPYSKTSSAYPRKQAPTPGPKSAAYKKLLASGQGAATKSSSGHAASKSGKKPPQPSAAYSSLKSRQRVVERIKRAIWAAVQDINDAIINLALAGNYNAARALFDFAGVYSLPATENAAPLAPAASGAAPPDSDATLDAFFKSIGVEPPIDEPQPNVAV